MWSWAEYVADWVVGVLQLTPGSGLHGAVHFFVYDLQKILVLIAVVSFVMALIRGALPMARIRAWLERPGGRLFGYPAAALFAGEVRHGVHAFFGVERMSPATVPPAATRPLRAGAR